MEPAFFDGKIGQSAQFKCLFPIPLSWTLNGNPLPTNVLVHGRSITVSNIGLENRGQYECQSQNSNGDLTYASSILTIFSMQK